MMENFSLKLHINSYYLNIISQLMPEQVDLERLFCVHIFFSKQYFSKHL
nr:MAG TPA: hypothetical protein [Caudoviricetes sp.]